MAQSAEDSLAALQQRLKRFRTPATKSDYFDDEERKEKEKEAAIRQKEAAVRREKENENIDQLFTKMDKDRRHYRWLVKHLETLGIKPKIGKVVREYLDTGREILSILDSPWRYLYDHGFRRAEISKVFYNAKEALQAYKIGRSKAGLEDLVNVAHYCHPRKGAKIIKSRTLKASKDGTFGPGAYITSTFLPDGAIKRETIAEHVFSNSSARELSGNLDCAILFKVPKSLIRVHLVDERPVEQLGSSPDSHVQIGPAKDPDANYVKIKLQSTASGLREMISNMENLTAMLKQDLRKLEEHESKKKARQGKKSGKSGKSRKSSREKSSREKSRSREKSSGREKSNSGREKSSSSSKQHSGTKL